MDLSEIVSITGLPGLYKVVNRRNDGLIVSALTDGKTQFIPGRTHMFSTLDNVTLYTTGEPAILKDVLASIKKNETSHPVPDIKNDEGLKTWLAVVLPEYDKEKVHVSDMKKLAKWYLALNDKNLVEELTAEKAAGEETAGVDINEKKEAKKENKAKAIKSDKSNKGSNKPAPAKKITTPRKAS